MLVEPHTAIPFNSIKQTFVADVKFHFSSENNVTAKGTGDKSVFKLFAETCTLFRMISNIHDSESTPTK